jgi:hypothetical protein
MLAKTPNNAERAEGFPDWTNRKALKTVLASMVIATLLGPILFSFVGGIPRRSEWLPALVFGSVFGAWVGLIAGVLFGSVRRVRRYGRRSVSRMILTFSLLGALAGGPVFFPFGDGLAMAFALVGEAAILGGIIGALVGLCLFLIMFR